MAQDVQVEPLEKVNFLDLEFIKNPYPTYQKFIQGPRVVWNESVYHWVFSHYKEVSEILRDNKRFSSDRARESIAPKEHERMKCYLDTLEQWMLFKDRPQHTHLRSIINKTFTPKECEKLRPRIEEIIEELINNFYQQGHMDLIWDFSYPLPAMVIAELLGVPKEDRNQLKQWSTDMIEVNFGSTPEQLEKGKRSLQEIMQYFLEIVHKRQKNPQDDLITRITTAEDDKGRKLSEQHASSQAILLLIAGHETTQNLIANGMYLLQKHPQQLQKLKEDPSLMKNAIEEFLRYEGPVQMLNRKAVEDVEFYGQKIKKGDAVMAILGAANRDPEVFANSNTFDITRTFKQPVMTFGLGIHFCIGAPLARIEAHMAFAALLQKLPNLQLRDREVEWSTSNMGLRMLKSLPMTF